jgi:hypothetical protein
MNTVVNKPNTLGEPGHVPCSGEMLYRFERLEIKCSQKYLYSTSTVLTNQPYAEATYCIQNANYPAYEAAGRCLMIAQPDTPLKEAPNNQCGPSATAQSYLRNAGGHRIDEQSHIIIHM